MNVKIYIDRYVESKYVDEAEKKSGTQFEENATTIKFDFSELDFLDDECVKTIHFFHDSLEEANYVGDSIIQNDEFKIPKSITEHENVVAFVQITKENFIWKTKSFDLHFNQSLDVDKTLDEDEIGILQELIVEVQQIKTDTFEEYKKLAEEETKKFNDNATTKFKEYNENHTTKLNAYNDNATEKITEYNENATAKIAEYDEHIEDLDNVVSKNTASGESVSIDDALEYKMFGAKVEGNSEQVTTTGKNLLKYQSGHFPGRVVESGGVTFTVNDDYSVTVNGTNDGNNSPLFIANGLTLPPGTYIGNLNGSGWKLSYYDGTGWLSWNVARTFEEETTFKEVYIEPGTRNKTYNGETIYPMLVAGDTSPGFTKDVYEPYTNGPSPNPDYPQEIKTITNSVKIKQVGKNLIAKDNTTVQTSNGITRTINEDGSITFTGTSTGNPTFYISANSHILQGKYTFSIGKKHTFPCQIRLNNNSGGSSYHEIMSNDSSVTFDYHDNDFSDNKFRMLVWFSASRCPVGTTVNFTIYPQLEVGDNETDYEEYKSNEYTIDLNDNELVKLSDDIKDTIEISQDGKVSLSKKVGKTILNGTESWALSTLNDYQWFRYNFSEVKAKAILMTDYLRLQGGIGNWIGITTNSTSERLYVAISDEITTVEQLKAWLSENNVTVYYELAELTTSNLGQLTNFKTYSGVNHFFLETNLATNFEIKYAQDLQKVISKQQEEIDELKTLLSSTATSALLLDNYANDLVEEV